MGETQTGHGSIRIGNRSRGDEGVFVARPSVFGNPFRTDAESGRDDVIEDYERYLHDEVQKPWSRVARALKQLAVRVANGEDLVLVCWCAPKRCHSEPIRELVYKLARQVQKPGG